MREEQKQERIVLSSRRRRVFVVERVLAHVLLAGGFLYLTYTVDLSENAQLLQLWHLLLYGILPLAWLALVGVHLWSIWRAFRAPIEYEVDPLSIRQFVRGRLRKEHLWTDFVEVYMARPPILRFRSDDKMGLYFVPLDLAVPRSQVNRVLTHASVDCHVSWLAWLLRLRVKPSANEQASR